MTHQAPLPPGARVPPEQEHETILLALVQAVLAALEPPHTASPLFIQQLLRALQTHLLARYGAAHAAGQGGLSPPQLLRAQRYLLGHPLQSLYVAAAAQHCGLSRGYFSKAFKLSTGQSPLQWALLGRIHQAAALLRCGTPLADVSGACGFASPRHLSRCFRRAMGMTPAVWRRQYP